MNGISESKKIRINKIVSYAEASLLPLILAVLFIAQNQAFNIWLKLYSKTYSVRLSLVTFALGLVLYGPALLFKKKFKYAYLFLISTLISLTFFSQFIYYRYSQGFLQFSALRYIWQADGVIGTVIIFLTPELLLFLSNIVIVLIALSLTFRKKHIEYVSPKIEKIIIVFFMAVMVFFGYKYLLDTEKKEWGSTSRLYTDVYDLKSLVGKMGIVNFFIEDSIKHLFRSDLVSKEDKQFLNSWVKNRPAPTESKKYSGAEKGKNIIIIQVESLENAVINTTINGQEITPNLNQLARQGMYFDNYYTQSGPGNTADAEFSTMNSLYPLADDVVFINYAKNQYYALPHLLTENGYTTASFHGDVPTFWNRSNAYPEIGYQKVFDLSNYIVTRPVGKGPSDLGDEDLFSQSVSKLASLKQPFLATLITMSSHTPFILPSDLQTLSIPADTKLNKNQQQYLESVHYSDMAIGEFIQDLKKIGLYENSLIFIWGDHGSMTNISTALGKDKNTLPELTDSQVPMIMLAPGTDLSGTNNTPASHLDVYPTITNLLGINAPKTVLGQDILNTKTPVETHFRIISDGIDAILTPNLVYQAGNDGIFAEGTCKVWPSLESLPVLDCQNLYNQQAENVRASDIIIEGNLLNNLLDKKK